MTVSGDEPTVPTPTHDEGTGTVARFGGAAPGGTMGRFAIHGVLGSGGMGVVLSAFDPDLDRKVALKVLHAHLRSGETRPMLQREAQAMAKLSHPNAVQVYEVGRVGEHLFIAMELVEGTTLKAWLAKSRRGWREVMAMFAAAGQGLVAAHEAGLVHRDFKPENVLIGKDGRPRVSDFGLAEVRDSDSGLRGGTPIYMAPEQWKHGELDARSDQFSFCVALWTALFGEAPFVGSTMAELEAAVCEGRRRARNTASERAVPGWLASIIDRGLAVDPAARWPSLKELLAEIDRRSSRRRRAGLIAGGLALVVVSGGVAAAAITLGAKNPTAEARCADMRRHLAGVWDPARRAAVRGSFENTGKSYAGETFTRFAKQLDTYTGQWVDARLAACRATHVHGEQSTELLDLKVDCLDQRLVAVDALLDTFAETPSPDALDRAIPAAYALAPLDACADADALRAAVPPPADPASRRRADELRAQIASAKALAETGQFERGRTVAVEAAAGAEELGYAPVLAEALYRLATLEKLTGDGKSAEATLERALVAAGAAHDDLLAAEVWGEIIVVVGMVNARPDEALRLRTAAMAALRRADNDRATEANLLGDLARVLFTSGRLSEAHDALTRALAIREEAGGGESPDVAGLLMVLGTTLLEQGKYDEGLVQYQRGYEIFATTFGPDHPFVAGALNNIANAYESLGRFEEARVGHERVLAMLLRSLGPDHPRVADSYQNLGNAYFSLDRYDQALVSYQKALAIQTVALGPDHPEVAQNVGNLARLYLSMERFEEARVEAERAIAIYEATLGDGLDIAMPLLTRATALFHLGRLEESRVVAEHVLRIRETEEGRPEEMAAAQVTLARTLLALGRERRRAVDLLTTARPLLVQEGVRGAAYLKIVDQLLAGKKPP